MNVSSPGISGKVSVPDPLHLIFGYESQNLLGTIIVAVLVGWTWGIQSTIGFD